MTANIRNGGRTLEESIAAYQAAIDSGLCSAENYSCLGLLFQQKQLNQQAAIYFRKALALCPEDAELHFRLATTLHAMGEFENAIDHYRHASQLQPDFHNAVAGEATMLASIGERDKACELLTPLIERGVENIHVVSSYAGLCKDADNRVAAISLIEKLLDGKSVAPGTREKGLFALGGLYEGEGDYARAFSCFDQANNMHPSNYSDARHEACISRLVSAYNPDVLSRTYATQPDGCKPVFIVGMPRSGTSLVEQIISSHPAVAACGELTLLGGIVEQLQSVLGCTIPYPDCVGELSERVAQSAVEAYLGFVKSKSGGALYTTDKMPENYLHLGFIKQILPQARIIHCVRDPLDTCVSCYFLRLNQRDYSYRLDQLGHYYTCYRRLMNYWTQQSGLEIMELQYEDLVANSEMKIRELVEFCGLEWNEGCNKFYAGKQVVRTASAEQATRPIYTSSVGRSRNYIKFLGPLVESLGMGSIPLQ